MADKRLPDLPLEDDNPEQRALWESLAAVSLPEPSDQLRENFYRELGRASQPSIAERLQRWLGIAGGAGWLTAAACLLLGLGLGKAVDGDSSAPAIERLAALEDNVSLLNRRLILDRLENATPSKRLRGVIDAGNIVGSDAEIAQALLQRATEDRVPSVRAAAIDALGPRINAPAVGEPLMSLLQNATSPLVQLALVDLVLRYGSNDQMNELQALAESDRLHPDLKGHVLSSLKRETV